MDGDPKGLWIEVCITKYGVFKSRWEVQVDLEQHLGVWKGIASRLERFTDLIRFKVGSGRKICFWPDTWVGDNPLAICKNSLF